MLVDNAILGEKHLPMSNYSFMDIKSGNVARCALDYGSLMCDM